GIRRHVDLLKFGDHVLGVCLGADATLTLRRIAEWALPVRAGRECALTDNDFDGRVVDVPVRAGDVYCLSGAARHQWTHEISPESICNGQRRV
ncbi:ANK1, partial [Symbiodinium necroappetens]